MSHQDISCGLEFSITPDLQACVSEALDSGYSYIVTPIVHPRFSRHNCSKSDRSGAFTRSDMVLPPQDWTSRVVGKLSPHLNVDSASPVVRQRHEDCLYDELMYSKGLGVPALLLNLHGEDSSNLARMLLSYFDASYHTSIIWTQVPMVSKRSLHCMESDNDDDPIWNETWHWWSKFHERLDWDKRVGVVLELSADLPPEDVVKRWLGEPVKAIIVPTTLFLNNKKGYPVLSRAHQQLVVSMVEHEAQVIVSGARRHDIQLYFQYLHRLWMRRPNVVNDPMLAYARGWEDYLQTPLQPLADNLDTHTYNVFEKDPIKYDQYQKAITQALTHLKASKEHASNENHGAEYVTSKSELGLGDIVDNNNQQPFTVMVLGAGRGPLVRATFNAADLTNTKVKVVAVEKNPSAVVVLAAQARELWRDRDITIVPGDMRRLHLSPKADIIVSELLGSWGDNELSPECLDGAAGLLRPGGISIPREYSSYVAPISSARLWAAAKVASSGINHNKDKNLESLWVVYMQNKHAISDTKRVFTFEHPAKCLRDPQGREMTDWQGLPITDNRRTATVSWQAAQDNVMHGFGGYFDCTLFGDTMISIVPSNHSPGMISWFPVFIPMKTPLRVHRGDVIKATFWRCVDARRVWYEWIVQVGDRTTSIHNINGRSSEMFL